MSFWDRAATYGAVRLHSSRKNYSNHAKRLRLESHQADSKRRKLHDRSVVARAAKHVEGNDLSQASDHRSKASPAAMHKARPKVILRKRRTGEDTSSASMLAATGGSLPSGRGRLDQEAPKGSEIAPSK